MNDMSVPLEETVQSGATWSCVSKRGTALRVTDSDGGATLVNVGQRLVTLRHEV